MQWFGIGSAEFRYHSINVCWVLMLFNPVMRCLMSDGYLIGI